MKLLTIALQDEEHTRIKTEAAKQGITIKTYLLGDKLVTTADDKKVVRSVKNPMPDNQKPAKEFKRLDLCDHYQPKGQCLTKGCKYAK